MEQMSYNSPILNTLVVNLFGGPTEYAKDKVWEGHLSVLYNQTYLLGKQQHRIHRLLDKVDVIITDSPLLMQITYCKDIVLQTYIKHEVDKLKNLNVFLQRKKAYNTSGRTQTFEEAKLKDKEILDLLVSYHSEDFITIPAVKESVETLFKVVMDKLSKK